MAKTYQYEGMFLISQAVAADLNGAVEHITEILGKAGAEIVSMKKWDERRLAYEIEKNKRGVFILVYFTAPGDAIGVLERECNLSEQILRMMSIRADHLTIDQMKAADARDELAVEAKLRAEKAAAASERGAGVSIGAPPQQQPEAPAEAPSEEKPAEEPAEEPAPAEGKPA